MIGYFDTSAVVPLVVAEPGSKLSAELWQASDRRFSSLLVIPEAHAALAQAWRSGRLTETQYRAADAMLDRRLAELDLVVPTHDLAERAARLAPEHRLRGYDAVHVATALTGAGPDLVAVAGDRALLRALFDLGVATVNITSP